MTSALFENVKEERAMMVKRVDTVKMMIFNSEIMRNLMMDLLDLAQMENSTFKLNKGYFSFFDVIQKAFGVLGHVAAKKDVTFVTAPVTEEEASCYKGVYGDQNRFLQVLINFLSNSLKFSNKNSRIVIHLKMLENQTIQMCNK